MSIYCTLPRNTLRESFSQFSTASATHSPSNETTQNSYPSFSSLESNQKTFSVRSAKSEMCLNSKNNREKLKLYYAVDSFEDLEKIRKSNLISLASNLDISFPNFYGDSDSAYNSSQESIRVLHPLVKNRKSNSKKYFTLPSRVNRLSKQIRSLESIFQESNSQVEKNHKIDVINAKETNDYLSNVDKINEIHCCCLLGCHKNDNSVMSNSSFDKNHKLHCCQSKLETLWEEPHANGNANGNANGDANEVFKGSLLSDLHLHEAPNFSNNLKNSQVLNKPALNQANHQCKNLSQGWLKGPILRALKKTKLRPKSVELDSNNDYSNQIVVKQNEIIQGLKKKIVEKDFLFQSLKNDSQNFLNQIKNLTDIMKTMQEKINHLTNENETLESLIRNNNMHKGQHKKFQVNLELADLQYVERNVVLKCGSQYIGSIGINSTTKWEELDELIEKAFLNYFQHALSKNCIVYYLVGSEKVKRVVLEPNKIKPELLPFGYLVDENLILIVIDESRI